MDLLVHGIYDADTFHTILSKQNVSLGFDLRGRSPNLIPFSVLISLLNQIRDRKFFLTFENDKQSTILSFLDLIKEHKQRSTLVFRDTLPFKYYEQINHPFYWFYHPDADWKTMLQVKSLKGVILPLKWKSEYKFMTELWDKIQQNNLDVYLHAENFSELDRYVGDKNLRLSVDLTSEIEIGYRKVDQIKLNRLKIWGSGHENFAGQ